MGIGVTVVVVVVLALLGGLFLLLPSPDEKRRMKLREYAFAQGIKVREARQEMKDWNIDVQESGLLMQYYLFNPEAKDGKWSLSHPSPVIPMHVVPSEDDLSAPLLPSEWASLPKDLVLWERFNQRYGFYWFEKDDEKALAKAIQLLKQLKNS